MLTDEQVAEFHRNGFLNGGRILDEDGKLRRFVNIYVDGEDIRYRDGFATELIPSNEISIVPSVAGGS